MSLEIKLQSELKNLKTTYSKKLENLRNYCIRIINQYSKSPHYSSVYNYIVNFYNTEYQKIINEYYKKENEIKEKYRLLKEEEEEEEQQQPVESEIHEQTAKLSACFVGINYENTSSELRGCANDVEDLCTLFSVYSAQKLVNEKATKSNIITHFKSLLQNANEGDKLLFTFSGHGYFNKDNSNDEVDSQDELIVTSDMQTILDDEFRVLITQYLKPNVTLFAIFDNCHSGTILDLPHQYFPTSFNKNTPETTGQVICISGCKDHQVSMDAYLDNRFNGALSWAFVDTIEQDKNKELTWKTLIEIIHQKLSSKGFSQLPQLTSGKKLDITQKCNYF